MRVVGLDLSLTGTGVATGLVQNGTSDTTVLSSPLRGVGRLAVLRTLILECCQNANLVVVEDYAFSRSGAHAHELGELGGVVRLALWDAVIPFAAVVPGLVKSFATGKGNANKTDMAVAAYKTAQAEFADDNQCDAWWLRQMGLYHLGAIGMARTAYRDNAVSKVAWPELAKAAS